MWGGMWACLIVGRGDAYPAGVDFVTAECVIVGTHFGGAKCVTFGVEELFDLLLVDCHRD